MGASRSLTLEGPPGLLSPEAIRREPCDPWQVSDYPSEAVTPQSVGYPRPRKP